MSASKAFLRRFHPGKTFQTRLRQFKAPGHVCSVFNSFSSSFYFFGTCSQWEANIFSLQQVKTRKNNFKSLSDISCYRKKKKKKKNRNEANNVKTGIAEKKFALRANNLCFSYLSQDKIKFKILPKRRAQLISFILLPPHLDKKKSIVRFCTNFCFVHAHFPSQEMKGAAK